MRSFGLIGIVLALAIVGWLATRATAPTRSAADGSAGAGAPPRQQVEAYQQGLQKALDQGAAARASEAAQ